MKKYTTALIAAGLVGLLSGCVASSQPSIATASKIDTRTTCSVEANGIKKVIETAAMYNEVAIKEGLEFRRLEVNNSNLIDSVNEAIKTGAKEVNPKNFKGKSSKTKLSTVYAAERACKFAIAALQQSAEAESTWRLAVPGDGYKY